MNKCLSESTTGFCAAVRAVNAAAIIIAAVAAIIIPSLTEGLFG